MYIIKKISTDQFNESLWHNIASIKINNYPWDKTGYKPATEVKLFYTDYDLRIKFTATEEQVRINESNFNGSVWQDSCIEFFFAPDIKHDPRYFNFEINAAGVLLLQLGINGSERNSMTYINPDAFEIKSTITKDNYRNFDNFKPWSIEYKIPFIFIKDLFTNFEVKSGNTIKANFYKCGDKTLTPHFGTWANIFNEVPAFHMPQFFQDIMFE